VKKMLMTKPVCWIIQICLGSFFDLDIQGHIIGICLTVITLSFIIWYINYGVSFAPGLYLDTYGGKLKLLGRNVNHDKTMCRVQVWPFLGQGQTKTKIVVSHLFYAALCCIMNFTWEGDKGKSHINIMYMAWHCCDNPLVKKLLKLYCMVCYETLFFVKYSASHNHYMF
jgi:hypothetical protein